MSTALRAAEAEKATIAYQIALTKLGAAVVAEALMLWNREVPTTGGVSYAASYMRKITALITRRRGEARALARAYYRYERALRTGYTVADPSEGRSTIDLSELRKQFADIAGPDADLGSSTGLVPVEPIANLNADAERLEREAAQEIRVAVGNLGPVSLDKKLKEISTENAAKAVDEERRLAHEQAGAKAAADAERIALKGARSELWQTHVKDRRAVGYIRLSRTGTPCGFCAMLISRGPVYKSQRSAEQAIYGDGDQYHRNCHCYAVPVYSVKDYKTSDLYALNREYEELWPQVTKGLGGNAALNAWRRFINQQNRAQAARLAQATQEA